MGKSYMQLKIVAYDLQELNKIIKRCADLGFEQYDVIQDNGEIYWTFMQIDNNFLDKSINESKIENDGE